MKVAMTVAAVALTTTAFAFGASAAPPDPQTCPLHEQHLREAAAAQNEQSGVPVGDATHRAEVDGRHDTLVASHETAKHSFRLFADGGAIELRATDPHDKATIEAVRAHLHDIVAQFVKNDFSAPAFVHGRPPAGVADMERLHEVIAFRYEDVDRGARIRMTTVNADALSALHEFLKFQVVEHHTDNTGKVEADTDKELR